MSTAAATEGVQDEPGQQATASPISIPWFFLDEAAAKIIIAPSLAGTPDGVRAVLYESRSGGFRHVERIAPGAHIIFDLADIDPRTALFVKLQVRRKGAWIDIKRAQRVLPTHEHEVHSFVPAEWGVLNPCIITVRDPLTRRVLWQGTAQDPHLGRSCVLNFAQGRKLSVAFHSIDPDTGSPDRPLISSIRLVPWVQRPASVAPAPKGRPGCEAHDDVILTPLRRHSVGGSRSSTRGVIGAWCDGLPVGEAMDFVMGKQRYLFRLEPLEAEVEISGSVIYMGRPNPSWGHFITEGLARVWFAARNPTIPTIWDGPALKPFQVDVLDRIGVTNPRHYLTRTTHIERVFFPEPAIGLGDYVTEEFTRAVGVVEPSTQQPGRRLFLSRSRLAEDGSHQHAQALRLDRLVEDFGFEVFHPQDHDIEVQLEAISSSETVLAVEGSALHTVLLLRGGLKTSFWALTRHRAGGGVFEHIKQAKRLKYQTLNFLMHPPRTAYADFVLDFDALRKVLEATNGLSINLDVVQPFLERPSSCQSTRSAQMRNLQVSLSSTESSAMRALTLLDLGNRDDASKLLEGLL